MGTLDAYTERILASIRQELEDARKDFRGASAYGTSPQGGSNLVEKVTQVSHGWSVGTAVIKVGSDFVLTDTDLTTGNIDTDAVPGVVGKIIDDDTALVVFFGLMCLEGLTEYSVYYLSTTPGGTTATKPTSGAVRPIFVSIADGLCWVGSSAAGSRLDDLEDVELTSPADLDVLYYDNASGKWINGPYADTIPAGSITSAMLRDSAACSVIGRAANSIGVPADIVASADDRVLVRSAGALSFAQVTPAMLSDVLAAGGPTGSASVVPVITYNAKGQLTAVTTATITPAAIGAVDTATYAAHTHSIAGDVGGTLAATVIGNDKVLTAHILNQNVTAAKILDHCIGSTQLGQVAGYTIIGNASSSTGDLVQTGFSATDGSVLRRKDTAFGFSAEVDLGTTGSGGGLFKCYFAASKYFEINATGVVTIFQTSTSKLEVNASTTLTITYANSNTVTIASADFVGSSKAIKIREIDVCDAGVAKKMLVLCSATY